MIQFTIHDVKDLVLPVDGTFKGCNDYIRKAIDQMIDLDLDLVVVHMHHASMSSEKRYYAYKVNVDYNHTPGSLQVLEQHYASRISDILISMSNSSERGPIMVISKFWSKSNPTFYKVQHFFYYDEFEAWVKSNVKGNINSDRVFIDA